MPRCTPSGARVQGLKSSYQLGQIFVAFCLQDPSWPDRRGECVLVHAAEGRIDGVAGVPIVRPDCVNRVRAGRDADVVSKEGALAQRKEQWKQDEVRVEGDVGHSDIRREAGPSVPGLGIEHVETGDGSVGELAKSAIVPGDADDASRDSDRRVEVLPSGSVVNPDRAGPAYAAVRRTGEQDVRAPGAVVVRDQVDARAVRGDRHAWGEEAEVVAWKRKRLRCDMDRGDGG